jgi:hypothetical protein
VRNISRDPDGWVNVVDRENHRIQVFDGSGRYETQVNNLPRRCGIFMPYCSCPICYVGELGPATHTNRDYPNLGPRLSSGSGPGDRFASRNYGGGSEHQDRCLTPLRACLNAQCRGTRVRHADDAHSRALWCETVQNLGGLPSVGRGIRPGVAQGKLDDQGRDYLRALFSLQVLDGLDRHHGSDDATQAWCR